MGAYGMVVDTRIFGEVTIDEDKIIRFINGIIGYPDLTEFALIHDGENGENAGIRWLQSMQKPEFAIPVVDPLTILKNYDPQVNDELFLSLGELQPEEMLVLVTVTVPKDITKMSVNLKAPVIINAKEKKACQIIVDGETYQVKYPIYEMLLAAKEAAEKGGE